ncbi:MAG: chemotaxis protein CheB [Steroidobacteraceae bacterium]
MALDATYVGDRPIDVILIGGSAGVLEVLRVILAGLPHALKIPVVIVVHVPERSPALLPQVLQPATPLPLKFAEDKEPLAGGTIYVAPAGYHLLLETNRCFALSIDPPVLFSRPAIDVLFESAADAYAGRIMAMLLTGASADGARGLASIHAAGGVTVVQAPQTAEAATMPAAAIALFDPDFVLSPPDIAALGASLSPYPRSAAWTRRTRNDPN